MGIPPDDLLRRLRNIREPGYTLPSDLELILKELMNLKAEIEKIKKTLKKHGIEID